MSKPDWVFGETLNLEDIGWHRVSVGEGGNDDQAGMLFLTVDEVMEEEGPMTAGLSLDEAIHLRDYLTRWIDWAGPYLERHKQKDAA